jgi:hypothetical protein
MATVVQSMAMIALIPHPHTRTSKRDGMGQYRVVQQPLQPSAVRLQRHTSLHCALLQFISSLQSLLRIASVELLLSFS